MVENTKLRGSGSPRAGPSLEVRTSRSRGRAATRLLDGHTLDARGRVPVQIGHRSRNALEQEVYPRLGDSDIGGELRVTMPQRPRQ